MTTRISAVRALLIFILLFIALPGWSEPVSLKRAVHLALAHSTMAMSAAADEQKALASYHETRNAYLPSVTVGAGLGASYGFPLSLAGAAPSLFNVNAQSILFNPAHREFMKAARTEYQASQFQTKDQRDQVMQDTVATYTELVNWEQRQQRMQQEESDAAKMEQAVAERVKEGVDSTLDLSKARLATARVRLRLAQARGSLDVLRQHLARLTGLPANSIETVAGSPAPIPAVDQNSDLAGSSTQGSPAVKLADERAIAAGFRARGEHRAMLPSFDFAAQYALLSKFNNYDVYYNAFQRHNATVGVSIVFPFLNFSQRARATGADAEALKAKKQAEAVRNQVSEETLKLQRSVAQLEAARDVAALEYEVSQSALDAAQGRTSAGTATLHELDDARAQAAERYLASQDAALELDRARIALMRSTGGLEKWVEAGQE